MRGIVLFLALALAAGLSGCAGADATSAQPWNQQQSWEQNGALGPALGH